MQSTRNSLDRISGQFWDGFASIYEDGCWSFAVWLDLCSCNGTALNSSIIRARFGEQSAHSSPTERLEFGFPINRYYGFIKRKLGYFSCSLSVPYSSPWYFLCKLVQTYYHNSLELPLSGDLMSDNLKLVESLLGDGEPKAIQFCPSVRISLRRLQEGGPRDTKHQRCAFGGPPTNMEFLQVHY